MSMENVFQIPGYKRILDGGTKIWERAVPVTTAKSNPVSFTNTRKTPFDALPHLKAFGATPVKHKAPALWGQYVPCDGITNASSTSIDTGVKAQDNIEMLVRFKAVTDSFYILQARETGSAKIYGLSGSQTGNTITSFGLTSAIKRTAGHICTVKMTMVNRAVTLYVKDETTGEEDTKTGTASASDYPFPSPTTIKLFGDASKIASGVTVYRAYIKVDGEMKWDMYPAVNVDNSNAPVAYDDVAHNASTVVSGSITGSSLIQPISYAESDGTAWADMGVKGTLNTKAEVTFKTSDATAYQVVFGARTSASTNDNVGVLVGPYESIMRVIADFGNYENGRAFDQNVVSTALKYKAVLDKNGRYIYNADTGALIASNTNAITASFTTADNLRLFDMVGKSATAGLLKGNIYSAKIWDNNALIRDYQPVRIGTTVELLDLVSWTFATRTGTFTAGADIPYAQLCPDIITVNTGDLKYGQYGKNLFDKSAVKAGYYLDDTGAEVTSTVWNISDFMPVVGGETYYQRLRTEGQAPRTCWYDANKQFISAVAQVAGGTLTAPANAKYCKMCVIEQTSTTGTKDLDYAMFTKGSAAPTEYEPYKFGLFTDGSHKLTVRGKNLIFKTLNANILSSGTLSADSSYQMHVAKLKANTTYAITTGTDPSRIYGLFLTEPNVGDTAYDEQRHIQSTITVTPTVDCYIAFRSSNNYNAQIEKGSTITPYEPYIPPTSRDIPMLLSADSFVDTQVDSNNKSEAWAVKVLDGVTAGLKFTSVRPLSTFYYSNVDQAGMTPSMSLICTHFENRNVVADGVCYAGNNVITFHHPFSTLEDANAWLASEYAKGTPVLVLYPLATPAVSTHAIAKVELTEKAQYTVEGTAELSVTEQATYLGVGV